MMEMLKRDWFWIATWALYAGSVFFDSEVSAIYACTSAIFLAMYFVYDVLRDIRQEMEKRNNNE